MAKLLLFVIMMVYWMQLQALQLEQAMAMQTLFHAKRAVNHAAHAAAQQLDSTQLVEGTLHIDEIAAVSSAYTYLYDNLLLEESGEPLPGSLLQARPEVLLLEIVNSEQQFPYHYSAPQHGLELTLYGPSVVMVVEVVCPQAFAVLEPIVWQVKGSAELKL